MSRPFKWQTSPAGLREMSDAEIDYIAYQVLLSFYAGNGATMDLTTTATGNTSIGSFTDTWRTEAIGFHPATGATSSDTTTIYQNRNAFSLDQTALPVGWQTSPAGLREMSQSDVNANIIARAVAMYNAQGVGSYYLGTSAPADGGTWVTKITINDEYGGSGGVSSTNYNIYRKSADTIPTVVRPMKWDTSVGGLKEASDAQLRQLGGHFREYLRTTGIGQYALQATAPATGTWVARGSIVDTRQSVTAVAYTGAYTSARAYVGSYTSNRGYVGSYTSNRGYVGTYTSNRGYVATYTSARGYVGTYTSTVGYVGTYTSTVGYVRYYGGVNYGTYSRAVGFNSTYSRAVGFNSTYTSNTAFNSTYTSATAFNSTYTSATAFNSTYTSATAFTGSYTSNTAFSGSYTGNTIASGKDTVTTLYLWQRTA